MRNLLPAGSVVRLKQDAGKLVDMMIFGYYGVNGETKQCYEYLGVIYPGGNAVETPLHMFNGDDIAEVVFEGYSTEESREALADLTAHTLKVLESGSEEAAPKQNEDLFF